MTVILFELVNANGTKWNPTLKQWVTAVEREHAYDEEIPGDVGPFFGGREDVERAQGGRMETYVSTRTSEPNFFCRYFTQKKVWGIRVSDDAWVDDVLFWGEQTGLWPDGYKIRVLRISGPFGSYSGEGESLSDWYQANIEDSWAGIGSWLYHLMEDTCGVNRMMTPLGIAAALGRAHARQLHLSPPAQEVERLAALQTFGRIYRQLSDKLGNRRIEIRQFAQVWATCASMQFGK